MQWFYNFLTVALPGYLLTPGAMFQKEQKEGYLSALADFIALTSVSTVLFILADIVTSDMFSLWQIGAILFIVIYYVLLTVITLVILHGMIKIIKRNANFVDSFKPVFIGAAYLMAIMILANISGLFMSTLTAERLFRVPLGMISAIIFLWITSSGILALHKISATRAFMITVTSFFMANLAVFYITAIYSTLFVSTGYVG